MKKIEQTYKIGDVAKASGTSIRTIRYYEEAGLIYPLRTDGGTRLYSQKHIARLLVILKLTECGYSLGIIKSLALARELHKTGDKSQKEVIKHLDGILAVAQGQIQQLQSLAKQIGVSKSIVQKCSGCKNKPTTKGCPNCPVPEHLSKIELLNLVWD